MSNVSLHIPTSTIGKHLNKLELNPLFMPIFSALTEQFDLVPADFLVIPTDGHIVGSIGDSLGPPPSRSPRDERRRSDVFISFACNGSFNSYFSDWRPIQSVPRHCCVRSTFF